MDIMPFYLVFLQSLPETAIIVALGLVLLGVKPSLLPLFVVALISALASYFIRALPLAPGINILLQFPITILLVTYFFRIPFTFAILSSSLGLICITLIEMVFNLGMSAITGIPIIEAVANPVWRVLFPLPEFMFLTVVVLGLNHYGISLFNLHEYREMEKVIENEER